MVHTVFHFCGSCGMKACARCKEEFPLSQFRWKNKTRGDRISYCRHCDKALRAERYEAKKEHLRRQQHESVRRKRELIARTGLQEPEAKICIDCGLAKPVANYRWRDKSLGRRVARCSECDRAFRADIYDRSKASFLDNNRRQYAKLRALLESHKTDPCMDCGREYPPYVLDFDHRDPTLKLAKVSSLVYRGSEQLLLTEIAKCDLVCSNCHRIRTHEKKRGRYGAECSRTGGENSSDGTVI